MLEEIDAILFLEREMTIMQTGKPRDRVRGAGRLGLMLLALAVLMAPRPGGAVERAMSVAELVAASTAVAQVEVTAVESDWLATPAGKLPYVVYRVQVRGVLSGPCPEELAVVVPGLISRDRIIVSPDEPAFQPGAQVVLFLRPAAAAVPGAFAYRITGSLSGVFPLTPSGEGQGPQVLAPVKDGGRVRIKLSDLAGQVRAARENLAREQKP